MFLKLVKAEKEEDRLKWSVKYGWSLVVLGLLSFITFGLLAEASDETNFLMDICGWIWIISTLLFMFRYTSAKPLLGAAAAGITVITIGTILDQLSNRRDGALGMGAMFGVIMVLFFICIKNLIVSWFYLIRETIRYVNYLKKDTVLDFTVLQTTK